MLRWSDKRYQASISRFKDKWNLDEVQYKKTAFRRERAYITPLIEKLLFNNTKSWFKRKLRKFLVSIDKSLNKFLSLLYDKKTSGLN